LGVFADEIGKALRRARVARGLKLLDVLRRSRGKFKPTSLAGYERGERRISVERFCELCDVYDVVPQAVLADAVAAVRGRTETEIDLRLERVEQTKVERVTGFVRQILEQRREPASGRIALREADVEVLAAEVGTTPQELAKALEPGAHQEG
jgi:transcriptional regulator with XRE-family HTH domain